MGLTQQLMTHAIIHGIARVKRVGRELMGLSDPAACWDAECKAFGRHWRCLSCVCGSHRCTTDGGGPRASSGAELQRCSELGQVPQCKANASESGLQVGDMEAHMLAKYGILTHGQRVPRLRQGNLQDNACNGGYTPGGGP